MNSKHRTRHTHSASTVDEKSENKKIRKMTRLKQSDAEKLEKYSENTGLPESTLIRYALKSVGLEHIEKRLGTEAIDG